MLLQPVAVVRRFQFKAQHRCLIFILLTTASVFVHAYTQCALLTSNNINNINNIDSTWYRDCSEYNCLSAAKNNYNTADNGLAVVNKAAANNNTNLNNINASYSQPTSTKYTSVQSIQLRDALFKQNQQLLLPIPIQNTDIGFQISQDQIQMQINY